MDPITIEEADHRRRPLTDIFAIPSELAWGTPSWAGCIFSRSREKRGCTCVWFLLYSTGASRFVHRSMHLEYAGGVKLRELPPALCTWRDDLLWAPGPSITICSAHEGGLDAPPDFRLVADQCFDARMRLFEASVPRCSTRIRFSPRTVCGRERSGVRSVQAQPSDLGRGEVSAIHTTSTSTVGVRPSSLLRARACDEGSLAVCARRGHAVPPVRRRRSRSPGRTRRGTTRCGSW